MDVFSLMHKRFLIQRRDLFTAAMLLVFLVPWEKAGREKWQLPPSVSQDEWPLPSTATVLMLKNIYVNCYSSDNCRQLDSTQLMIKQTASVKSGDFGTEKHTVNSIVLHFWNLKNCLSLPPIFSKGFYILFPVSCIIKRLSVTLFLSPAQTTTACVWLTAELPACWYIFVDFELYFSNLIITATVIRFKFG